MSSGPPLLSASTQRCNRDRVLVVLEHLIRPGGYLQHISKDPWGSDYHYENPGAHGKQYDLYTLGADNQPGGEGANADIGNWNVSD